MNGNLTHRSQLMHGVAPNLWDNLSSTGCVRFSGCRVACKSFTTGTLVLVKKNYLTCSLCHQSMHTVGVREPGAKIMQNHVRCFLLPRSELCKIRQSNNKQEPFLDGRIATRHSALIEIFFFTFKCFVISYGNYNNIPS